MVNKVQEHSTLKLMLCPSLAFVYVEVLTVGFMYDTISKYEAIGTVEVKVIANEMSNFDYTVNLTTMDITAGEINSQYF